MRPAVLIALLAVAALSLSCDEYEIRKKQSPTPVTKPKATHAIHRFAMTRYDGGVAFDTQTGQICKTWGWQPTGKAAAVDPISGMTPQRAFGEFAPTCLSLYSEYPSGDDATIEVTPDQPTN